MKGIFNRVTGLIAAIIFAALIALFVLNLRQEQASSTNNTQGQSGYPPPQNAAVQPAAYPGPTPRPPGELATIQAQNSCTALGEWTTYTNTEIGYALQYPTESELVDSGNYISIFLKPYCYGQTCWGSNRIIVSAMENPETLPIEQFVEEVFKLETDPPHNESVQNFETSKSFVEVAGVQALRIEKGITFNQPDIFIPHGEQVIHIFISADNPVPPHGPPCEQTLDLLDAVLVSIQFVSS